MIDDDDDGICVRLLPYRFHLGVHELFYLHLEYNFVLYTAIKAFPWVENCGNAQLSIWRETVVTAVADT